MIKDEKDVSRIIHEDQWMMEILHTARTLHLPDWWICAGFVRAKIWDVLHGNHVRTVTQDIDVIYFDRIHIKEEEEKRLENMLSAAHPGIPWSVKNEARMHIANGIAPYKSSEDAIAKFPETATALGVKIDAHDRVILTAPHGFHDAIQMIVKPTLFFQENPVLMEIFNKRVKKKDWQSHWPKITIES